MKVADLRSASGGWNEGRLRSLFPIQEVEVILSIHVVHTSIDDWYLWHYNKHGKYWVKSGYWVVMNEQRRVERAASLSADVTRSILTSFVEA